MARLFMLDEVLFVKWRSVFRYSGGSISQTDHSGKRDNGTTDGGKTHPFWNERRQPKAAIRTAGRADLCHSEVWGSDEGSGGKGGDVSPRSTEMWVGCVQIHAI